jgi:hypothetical protein
MRIACWIATAVFCLFSYWQLNDLDQYGTALWWVWVLVYLVTALVSLASSFQPLSTKLYLGAAALAFFAAGIRITDVDWSGPILFDETNPAANESGGLLVICVWFGFIAWRFGTKDVADHDDSMGAS